MDKSVHLVPDYVEDEDVFLDGKLNNSDLLFAPVVLEIKADKFVDLVLEHLVVHAEDSVEGAPVVGVDDLDPRVAVGVELVYLRRPLAVVDALVGGQSHQRRCA